ncbi:DEAD/DEAH box helicase [Bacillus sp. V59.32b]|uniref:DEAD/DEAH box helicase n=1 Tax=Bacillus sp. V59.32b TaxID=1758642 RepID=UPI000E3E3817|nr:DEAD/DEAH box helicase [Bacillus sp. V59.32b]RFU66488.1 helicase SNF [Bacillus sp. V59.32b]
MNIKLTQKIIKEQCGTVSFKRGEAFYRANKVTFENYYPNHCEATVAGTENFHVTIEKEAGGGFRSICSCPALTSFQSDCQHIAAVLLAINEHQRQGTTPLAANEFQIESSVNQVLTEGLLNLFNEQPIRSSGQQLHFENRQVLEAEFTCKPLTIGKGRHIFGIEVKIGPTNVQNIRDFFEQVKDGNRSRLSNSFIYDPSLHCFQKESDPVIQQLIQVTYDEKMYVDALPDKSDYPISNHILLIPPSSWEQLVPVLSRAPSVKLAYDGKIFDGLHLYDGPLPLQFDFSETEAKKFVLKVKGLSDLIVMDSCRTVLIDGKLAQLKSEDCKRLADLKQMLDVSGTNQIPIPHGQVGFFLEKVVPGLKKLGDLQLSGAITGQFSKTPLIAKLYLDRVKNRLLAGLEFHYENIVINPLENRELPSGSMLFRDVEKEDLILQLMEESLFARTDGGYVLHNEELEYEFLYHVVPKLEKLVQVYATTAVRNRIFRENARPMIRVKVNKERTNWLDFKFEMDGIPQKDIREILLALEEKRKYHRLRNGSLFSLETREWEEINRFLKTVPIQDQDLESGFNVPIVRGLQLLDSVDDNNAFKLEESFRQFLENIRNPKRLEFEVPKRLEPILRDYQKRGYHWMKTLANYGFGGILADDMGLGKTLQSIAFILSELPNIRRKKLPVLIVCPSSLTYNWLSEMIKFAPDIRTAVNDGTKEERVNIQKNLSDLDVIITSYPLLRKDIKWFEKQTFHSVFFDEAQAFKNPSTLTARAVKKIQANHRFALTGTPVENSLLELWSIFHVVFPELFLGLEEYSNLSRKRIARRIRPFLLRRLKEDVLSELPEKTESMEAVELLPDQKKLYAAYLAKLRHDTFKHLDQDTLRKNRIKILAGLTRLRQICCHPALFVDGYKGSSAKFEQLMQIIEEAKLSGRRVLIFSQFTKMLQLIGKDLAVKGLPFFYLDGQTPSEERLEICNRFNAGERDLFLISLKAGGTGLNLTGADTVILYDTWWNPAVEEQAADRAHRIGQTNAVQVIKLVTRGTIEEKINELQEKKRHLIEEIIDSKEKASSSLTEEDIREILMI